MNSRRRLNEKKKGNRNSASNKKRNDIVKFGAKAKKNPLRDAPVQMSNRRQPLRANHKVGKSNLNENDSFMTLDQLKDLLASPVDNIDMNAEDNFREQSYRSDHSNNHHDIDNNRRDHRNDYHQRSGRSEREREMDRLADIVAKRQYDPFSSNNESPKASSSVRITSNTHNNQNKKTKQAMYKAALDAQVEQRRSVQKQREEYDMPHSRHNLYPTTSATDDNIRPPSRAAANRLQAAKNRSRTLGSSIFGGGPPELSTHEKRARQQAILKEQIREQQELKRKEEERLKRLEAEEEQRLRKYYEEEQRRELESSTSRMHSRGGVSNRRSVQSNHYNQPPPSSSYNNPSSSSYDNPRSSRNTNTSYASTQPLSNNNNNNNNNNASNDQQDQLAQLTSMIRTLMDQQNKLQATVAEQNELYNETVLERDAALEEIDELREEIMKLKSKSTKRNSSHTSKKVSSARSKTSSHGSSISSKRSTSLRRSARKSSSKRDEKGRMNSGKAPTKPVGLAERRRAREAREAREKAEKAAYLAAAREKKAMARNSQRKPLEFARPEYDNYNDEEFGNNNNLDDHSDLVVKSDFIYYDDDEQSFIDQDLGGHSQFNY